MAEQASAIAAIKVKKEANELEISEIHSEDKEPKDNQARVTHLLRLNISGHKFVISRKLTQKFPASLLAGLNSGDESYIQKTDEYYFDRNPDYFSVILDIYRYKAIAIPSAINLQMLNLELKFWKVKLSEDKLAANNQQERLDGQFEWIEGRLKPLQTYRSRFHRLQYKMWWFLTDPLGPYTKHKRVSMIWMCGSLACLLIYLVCIGIKTNLAYREPVDSFIEKYNATQDNWQSYCETKLHCQHVSEPKFILRVLLTVMILIFTIESLAKFFVCPHKRRYYLLSVVNWCDCIVTLTTLIHKVMDWTADYIYADSDKNETVELTVAGLECFLVLRMMRIFQYTLVIEGLPVMILTIRASLRELLLLVMYMIIGMFFYSTLVTFLELFAPPEGDDGIPNAFIGYWWALITMTTVGYGDFYPQSTGGRIIGVLCAWTGLIFTALPVAIIGSNFSIYWEHNNIRKERRRLYAELLKPDDPIIQIEAETK